MLVTLKEILQIGEEKKNAVGAFNTPNLECLIAVLNASRRTGTPVIISHAELHETVAPLDIIGPIMLAAAKSVDVPVCVHLDHCENLSYMQAALKLGFTGVMYDGSALSYEQNVENTKRAVAMAKNYGAGVEAEIGTLAAREGGLNEGASGPVYTEPALALRFCADTGIDALAVSFGTAHGIYKAKPLLDLPRVKEIADITKIPLVMHGGSGVSREDFRAAIRSGIRKVNYYSYMAQVGAIAAKKYLCENEPVFFHDAAYAAGLAMQADVEAALFDFSLE